MIDRRALLMLALLAAMVVGGALLLDALTRHELPPVWIARAC